MPRDLTAFRQFLVFLNYPYDAEFAQLELGLNFAVASAGLLPISAREFSAPDQPRLISIVHAIQNSNYSMHDLSRYTGEGPDNFARMNMPVEMGMALFHALRDQMRDHRCVFFVPTPHEYQRFASDLAGLDPKCHNGDASRLVAEAYGWLRSVVPRQVFNDVPAVEVVDAFNDFLGQLQRIRGSGENGAPTHTECRELIYQVCAARGWWDWRGTRMGRDEFPTVPLAWRLDEPDEPRYA